MLLLSQNAEFEVRKYAQLRAQESYDEIRDAIKKQHAENLFLKGSVNELGEQLKQLKNRYAKIKSTTKMDKKMAARMKRLINRSEARIRGIELKNK